MSSDTPKNFFENVLDKCQAYPLSCWSEVQLASLKKQKEFQMTNPASERQVSYINTLIAERGYPEPIDLTTLTSRSASELITKLMALPKLTSGSAKSLAQGMYHLAGEIYRLKESRETGRLYAKRLTIDNKFEYAPGIVYRLTSDDKMTLEQAKAYGVETGFCCVCGAFLTDERSVSEGIGPVCARKYF